MGWDGSIEDMGQLADRIADLAEVPARASKAVSFEIEGFLQEEFDAGRDPYGSAWVPLAEATLAKGRTPPPLTDTGALRDGLRVRPLRGAGIAITSDEAYAAPHQTGWSGPVGDGPARPILPALSELPEEWTEAIDEVVAKEFRNGLR